MNVCRNRQVAASTIILAISLCRLPINIPAIVHRCPHEPTLRVLYCFVLGDELAISPDFLGFRKGRCINRRILLRFFDSLIAVLFHLLSARVRSPHACSFIPAGDLVRITVPPILAKYPDVAASYDQVTFAWAQSGYPEEGGRSPRPWSSPH